MASIIYPKWKQNIMGGASGTPDASSAINTSSSNVKAILVSPSYTYASSHINRSDISASFVGQDSGGSAIEVTLGTLTLTDGQFKCATGVTFTSVAASPGPTSADRVALFTFGGANSRLIALIDLPNVVSFTGNNVTVNWSTSPDYIFQL